MSREGPTTCASPEHTTPPSAPKSMPSSSRTSSSSSLRVIGLVNGSSDRIVDLPPPLTSSSQSSLPTSGSDVMPQAEVVAVDGSGTSTPDIDDQIIEALKSKDRLFVLKLGEQMEALIREKNSRYKISLSPENQYQRLLVHRCAAYYKLTPETDSVPRDKSGVRDMNVSTTMESRIPPRRISELVPPEQTQHPMFKIMRRTEPDRRRQKSSISRPGSTAGEDGELSDPGPSEAGSMGSRSTASKQRMTIAEREAAYERARSRIFMDFEEKEKAKERDTSASSSTLSLASASGSGSQNGCAGSSSVSDVDDNASTAPTESEWSVPVTDRRRGHDSGLGSADSSRSFPPFNADNGRVSGTASPAFSYPSLYDASGHTQAYEQPANMPPSSGYVPAAFPSYFYQHPPPNAGPPVLAGPPYVAPYQYFPPYAYPSPPQQHPSHSSSDPTSPASGPHEGYPHHSASVPYMSPNAYGWIPPASHVHQGPSENRQPPNPALHPVQSPPGPGAPPIPYPYPPYMLPPPGPVPYTGYPPYFQPAPQSHTPIIHPHSQPLYPVEFPTNSNGPDRGVSSGMPSGNGSPSPTLSRRTNSSGSSNGPFNHPNGNGGHNRGGPAGRGVWSYGPGPNMHANLSGPGVHSPETVSVGPRLSSAMRRTSGASSGSSGYRTPADETASVASSSTSSSQSRRTYMSTPPKHPLPPRPDWAAGIKAQPTLHPPVRHRHDSNNSRTMSPARPPGQQLHNTQQPAIQQRPPGHLQPTDFPPLSSISNAPTEKRPPAGSAWSNTSPAARLVLSTNPTHSAQLPSNIYGTALFNHSNGNRLEDDERGFERPPRKSNAELFNPKASARRAEQLPAQSSGPEGDAERMDQKVEKDGQVNETDGPAGLVDKLGSLKIQTQPGETDISNNPDACGVLPGLLLESNIESDHTTAL